MDKRNWSNEELIGRKVALSLHYKENGKAKYAGGQLERTLKHSDSIGYYVEFKGRKLPVKRNLGIVFGCDYGIEINTL